MVRSFQLETLQYLPDVPLVRLNGDAVATSLDDPIQHSPTLLKVCVFSNHLLLDLIFPRYLSDEKFHHRSFTTVRDVVSVHGCHDMFALDAALPHAWACDPSRQLEIAECRCTLSPPNFGRRRACRSSCIATARTCARHQAVRRIHFFVLEGKSTAFTSATTFPSLARGDLRQHNCQPPRVVALARTTWASCTSCIPSRPTSRARWAFLAVPCQSPPILS